MINQSEKPYRKVSFEHWREEERAKRPIQSQVPGILQDHTGIEKPTELREQELFYRAIGR